MSRTVATSEQERDKARSLAYRAYKKGDIVKPKTCQQCGETGKLSMHHEDYLQPLAIVWLCRSCHLEADRALRPFLKKKIEVAPNCKIRKSVCMSQEAWRRLRLMAKEEWRSASGMLVWLINEEWKRRHPQEVK